MLLMLIDTVAETTLLFSKVAVITRKYWKSLEIGSKWWQNGIFTIKGINRRMDKASLNGDKVREGENKGTPMQIFIIHGSTYDHKDLLR